MKNKNNMADFRDMLVRMETRQLEEMLWEELRKEAPDGQLVRLIGSVLENREEEMPDISPGVQNAWENYQRKKQPIHNKAMYLKHHLIKAACLILVLVTFFTILPQEASAKSFFERIVQWTTDIFSLTSPGENRGQAAEYVFRTDHPGLQTVYDKVTELGVTAPVVPTWLPEGYELVRCSVQNVPTKQILLAVFSDENNSVIYQLDIYSDSVTHEYCKDDAVIRTYERNGTVFTILRNIELWTVVWTTENIECSIFIDCPEDILIRILDSIYMMEEK